MTKASIGHRDNGVRRRRFLEVTTEAALRPDKCSARRTPRWGQPPNESPNGDDHYQWKLMFAEELREEYGLNPAPLADRYETILIVR
jgi:hypothetical protein